MRFSDRQLQARLDHALRWAWIRGWFIGAASVVVAFEVAALLHRWWS